MPSLTTSLSKIGKTNGIYLSPQNHLYIAFTKQRYADKFTEMLDQKAIPGLEDAQRHLLREAVGVKRCIKRKAAEMGGLGVEVPGEVLNEELFLKVVDIPKGTKKYKLREGFYGAKPRFIEFSGGSEAVVRFSNAYEMNKFLNLHQDHCVNVWTEKGYVS